MINWVVNKIRQMFCKHEIVSIRSDLPTRKIKTFFGYRIYDWNEYVTILHCKHCTFSKKIKHN